MKYRIKEILKQRGSTLIELSNAMGITDVALRYSISHNPTMSTLEKIAGVLGVRVSELLDEQTEEQTEEEGGVSVSVICPHCGKRIKMDVKIH